MASKVVSKEKVITVRGNFKLLLYAKSFPHAETLFSDAKGGEDVVEDIVGGDFAAGDFGEMVEACAKVFGNEIGGSLGREGLLCPAEGFEGLQEGVVVADVCHDGMCVVERGGQG